MTATGRVSIDPRLRARRVAVRRSQGRRRLRRLMILLGVTAIVLLGVALTRSPLLDVDHVRVDGAARTTPAAVVEASGVETGQAMTDVDLGAARAAIAELPWIADVSIERSWPGSVEIEVVERRPVAAYPSAGGLWTVLDRDGRVLAVNAAVPDSLVLIDRAPASPVPGTVETDLDDALLVADALTPDLAAWIEAIVPVDGGVELELVGGATAEMAVAEVDGELTSLATVLSRVELECITLIDVSVPRSPVVQRSQDCLAAAADADGETSA